MIKNYFIVAIRHILKNKLFTFINISGLAIGMTGFILLSLYVYHELQYDKYNKNLNRLYRIINQDKETGEYDAVLPVKLKKYLEDEIPEVEKAGYIGNYECDLKADNKVFHEVNFFFCDSSILDMFSWKIIEGNKNKPFKNANSVLISPEMAKKYFGNENPIGRIIRCDDTFNFVVSGVIEIPQKTHLKIDFLASSEAEKDIYPSAFSNWYNSSCTIYLLLKDNDNIDVENVEEKIGQIAGKNSEGELSDVVFELQPVDKIHLYSSNIQYDQAIKGDIVYVKAFVFIAILILIIAALNYVNLSTAKSGSRVKEIGVRKVLGAHKKKLIYQMLGETLLITFIAALFSLLLLEISIPFFNKLSGIQISLMTNLGLIAFVLLFLIGIISLFAGIYPAFILSSLHPAAAVKGTKQIYINLKQKGIFNIGFRKTLFIVQICITMGLIITSVVIYKQVKYIAEKDMGFNREQLLVIDNPMDDNFMNRYEHFKNAISKNPYIEGVTAAHNVPSKNINNFCGIRLAYNDEEEQKFVAFISVDFNYFKTLGAKIVKGRDFSEKNTTDSINACIINEATAKMLGLKDPIGKKLKGFYGNQQKEIIGVVKDINFRSLHYKVQPMVFIVSEKEYPWFIYHFIVKVRHENISQTLNFLEKEFKKLAPQWAFNYYFVDKSFENLYKKEESAKSVITVFTLLAILISVIGLYGLIYFIAESKTKEISIRKVFGAKVDALIRSILLDFFKLIIIASIIIVPVSWVLLSKWLNTYIFHIKIGVWIYFIAFLISAFIVFATIIFKTYQAANINPAKALKYE